MMKLKATSLLGLGLVSILSGTLWCQNIKTYHDIIFVIQTEKEGMYSEKTGHIVTLTSSEIIMETEGNRLLYTHEAVKRIEPSKARECDHKILDEIIKAIQMGRYKIKKENKDIKDIDLYEDPVDDYQELKDKVEAIQKAQLRLPDELVRRIEQDKISAEKFQENVDIYWNKKKSLIISVIQNTPPIGHFFSFLDILPGMIGTFLAVLILISILSYGVYKLYQMLVVATNLRDLNRTKLNMEISKLHFDIESIKKELGLTEKIAPTEIQAQKIDIKPSLKIPEVHILDFIKYKIFHILTEEKIQRRTKLWQKKWQGYKDRPAHLRVLYYYARLSMNFLATILVAIYSMGSFVDIILPFIDPEFPGGPFISLIFLLTFVVLFAYLLRLNTQRRIMRKTYRESKT